MDIARSIDTAKRAVLSIGIGEKWQTFAGVSYYDLCEQISSVLDDLRWKYESKVNNPTIGEHIMFGADKSKTYKIPSKEITIELTSVTYDPLQRAFLNVVASSDTKNKYKDSVTIIKIFSVNEGNEDSIAEFIQQLVSDLDKDPWKISHPRFKYSPLLNYKVKVLWDYWLN